MRPKSADGKANSVGPDQTAQLIWVGNVYSELFVIILRFLYGTSGLLFIGNYLFLIILFF